MSTGVEELQLEIEALVEEYEDDPRRDRGGAEQALIGGFIRRLRGLPRPRTAATVRRLITEYKDDSRRDRGGAEQALIEEFIGRLEALIEPEGPLGAEDLKGNQVVERFGDTTIRFKPPYSKARADYVESGDPDFDESHRRCGECVHYIPGGGCHFVQGAIRPLAYCAEFYADYGVFAHDHGDHIEVNAELYGEAMAFDERDIHDFLDDVEERLQQRRREREAESERSHNPGNDEDSGRRRGYRRLYSRGD